MPKRSGDCDKAVAIFEQRTFAISSTANGYLPLLARSLTFVSLFHSSAIQLLVPTPLSSAPRPILALSPCFQPSNPPVASVSPLSLGALCLYSHWFARQCLLEDLFQYFQLKLDKAVFDNACVFRRSSCDGKNNVVRANDQEWFSAVSLHRGGTFQAVGSVCVENVSSMGERTAIANAKQSSVYTE